MFILKVHLIVLPGFVRSSNYKCFWVLCMCLCLLGYCFRLCMSFQSILSSTLSISVYCYILKYEANVVLLATQINFALNRKSVYKSHTLPLQWRINWYNWNVDVPRLERVIKETKIIAVIKRMQSRDKEQIWKTDIYTTKNMI